MNYAANLGTKIIESACIRPKGQSTLVPKAQIDSSQGVSKQVNIQTPIPS